MKTIFCLSIIAATGILIILFSTFLQRVEITRTELGPYMRFIEVKRFELFGDSRVEDNIDLEA